MSDLRVITYSLEHLTGRPIRQLWDAITEILFNPILKQALSLNYLRSNMRCLQLKSIPMGA